MHLNFRACAELSAEFADFATSSGGETLAASRRCL
jgi:hypothetical protein